MEALNWLCRGSPVLTLHGNSWGPEVITRLHQQSSLEHDVLAYTWYFPPKKFGSGVQKCFEAPLAVPITSPFSVLECVALLGKRLIWTPNLGVGVLHWVSTLPCLSFTLTVSRLRKRSAFLVAIHAGRAELGSLLLVVPLRGPNLSSSGCVFCDTPCCQ